MAIKHEQRGVVREIMLVVQYPDNSIKVGQLNAQGIKSIIFNHDDIVGHVGESSDLAIKQWNTGNWKENPTVLIVGEKNRYDGCGWYCKHAGHRSADHLHDLHMVQHDESESSADEIRRKIAILEEELNKIE